MLVGRWDVDSLDNWRETETQLTELTGKDWTRFLIQWALEHHRECKISFDAHRYSGSLPYPKDHLSWTQDDLNAISGFLKTGELRELSIRKGYYNLLIRDDLRRLSRKILLALGTSESPPNSGGEWESWSAHRDMDDALASENGNYISADAVVAKLAAAGFLVKMRTLAAYRTPARRKSENYDERWMKFRTVEDQNKPAEYDEGTVDAYIARRKNKKRRLLRKRKTK